MAFFASSQRLLLEKKYRSRGRAEVRVAIKNNKKNSDSPNNNISKLIKYVLQGIIIQQLNFLKKFYTLWFQGTIRLIKFA
jgi:hypothetical protein